MGQEGGSLKQLEEEEEEEGEGEGEGRGGREEEEETDRNRNQNPTEIKDNRCKSTPNQTERRTAKFQKSSCGYWNHSLTETTDGC